MACADFPCPSCSPVTGLWPGGFPARALEGGGDLTHLPVLPPKPWPHYPISFLESVGERPVLHLSAHPPMDRPMKRFAALALLLLPGTLGAQSSGVAAAAASITEADFYDRVGIIAHDSMMGRDTPSPGLDLTARWIADEFRRFGLKPGGDDGSYLQEYVIQQVAPDFENT